MAETMTRAQMLHPLSGDAAFVAWYVEEFMKRHVPEAYFNKLLSDQGRREMTLQGRRYAESLDIRDVPSQAHFITLMWKIGPDFWRHDGFAQVAQADLAGPAKIDRFYAMPADLAIAAITGADMRYWYPHMVPEPEPAA